MPTIATLLRLVVVIALPFIVLLFVVALADKASRNEHHLEVDLRARLFRLKVSSMPTRCRSTVGLSAPDQRRSASEDSEKTS